MKTGKLRKILSTVLAVLLVASLMAASAAADDGHEEAKKAAVAFLKSAVADKCPIASFETDDPLLSVTSYTYDSAIAALALMSEGDYESASAILDGFVDAMQIEEYKDRLRNASMAGNAATPPGYWNNAQGAWLQDAFQVGTGTKSSCAAAVALLTYHRAVPNEKYLNTAVTVIKWVMSNCHDDNPGYTAGFTGWKTKDGVWTDLTYKSTSDNLWMAAACHMLARATGWDIYDEAAASATQFVKEKMYSAGDSRFFQGTAEDGVTPVANLILVDVQALAELSLGDDSGMDNIAMCRAGDGGYAYDNSNISGSWLEGSAIAALALKEIGEKEKANAALSMMEKLQLPSGIFPQTSIPELKTGEKDRVIENIPSVAPCAWFILAVNGTNPLREN